MRVDTNLGTLESQLGLQEKKLDSGDGMKKKKTWRDLAKDLEECLEKRDNGIENVKETIENNYLCAMQSQMTSIYK